jgi:glycosyltransferase involved in cell wall biosynthesis
VTYRDDAAATDTDGGTRPHGLVADGADPVELTILMPCLNEAETVGVCVRKARRFLIEHGIDGEVVVADNGSTDGSQQIAEAEGARVIAAPQRGYGAALLAGIAGARGRYVIMGDADDSYDFTALMPFLGKLRDRVDLVMGNRLAGGIAPGAMPFLHRYLGNPVLSWLGRSFFRIRVADFHCGLRGFDRDRIRALELRTTGMEFASEMIVRSALANYRIAEVPTTLRPDGRTRPPHLRTWRDGWRHLVFLLLYSPRWLYIYPGLALLVLGIAGASALLPGVVIVGGVGFDIHTFIVACFFVLLGAQAISFGILVRRFAVSLGFMPPSRHFSRLLDALSLERILIAAAILLVIGVSGMFMSVREWAASGFGALQYSVLLRMVILSMTTIAFGIQLAFMAFLLAIMEIPSRQSLAR